MALQRPRARPRFSVEVAGAADAISASLKAHLARGHDVVEGSVHPRTVNLWVKPAHRHFWSPHLDLQLTEKPDGSTRLDGLFAPHPQVWTAFIALQLLFALLSIAAGVFLISQLTLGGMVLEASLALVTMLVGGGLAYGGAYVGQGLGSEQMYELRAFVDQALAGYRPMTR
jgi:hypothetical protein